MLAAAIAPLPGHAVFLLLLQLALLLIAARVGAELSKLVGLPSVIGELAAGIVLGPSVFGHFLPTLFDWTFPADAEQFHLLESVGTLGMVLLLLLTGLETDLKLLKNLGRAALVASAMGMFVDYLLGFGLGMVMPATYLAQPDHRPLFALFLALSMSISAMPVIAKILMDLDLTKRNIGLVILSAGVVDDTTGWIMLSVIVGIASRGGVNVLAVGRTLGLVVLFLAGSAFLLYPLLRFLIRISQRFKTHDGDLAIVIITTFIAAAVTEKIGVHAVFGAFIVGTVLRQIPQLKSETVHKLESFVMAVLAPIFFGVVGLKVNLWTLGGGGGGMLAIVLGIACFGKLFGCTVGGLWGGLRFWEALSIAVAMNARGAMELVVATIGLSLGILNQQMFSIIVVVAISTSFLAPILLRLTMRMVRITDEEQKRILAEQSKGAFDPRRLRVLVPTAGGPNALEAMRVATQLAARSDNAVEVVYIDVQAKWWQMIFPSLRRNDPSGRGIDEHLAAVKKLTEGRKPPAIRRLATRDVAAAILDEARKGADVIMIGASQRGQMLGGKILHEVVEHAPCHVAIMRGQSETATYKKLLVPVDGGIASRTATEFAVRYAEASGASLTLALLDEQRTKTPALQLPAKDADDTRTKSLGFAPAPLTPEEELERLTVVFRTTEVKPTLLRLDPTTRSISQLVETGDYDLVVIGAENRAIQNRLFFGRDNERLIQESPVAVIVIVPNISMLH